ncbi:MAG TPA: MarR family transcriptional regulator [Egibacteraceae bacterium]|nr:MarR family transcriptional regulator [Egibacteraceae bacterium]
MVAASGGEQTTGEIAELVFEFLGRLRAHFEDRVAEFELTASQAMALKRLDEPVAMRELAGLLRCDASNVTGIVDRLEQRELVERRVDPSDRRVKHLVLTPAGRRLRGRLESRLRTDLPGLAQLSVAQQASLRDLLRTMLGRQSRDAGARTAGG